MQYLNDLPLGISLVIVVLLTVAIATGFLIFTRVYIRRHFNISDETDDTVAVSRRNESDLSRPDKAGSNPHSRLIGKTSLMSLLRPGRA